MVVGLLPHVITREQRELKMSWLESQNSVDIFY